MAKLLPAHVDESLLVPYPQAGPGHWYYPDTDDVFATGPDYTPEGFDRAKWEAGEAAKRAAAPVAETPLEEALRANGELANENALMDSRIKDLEIKLAGTEKRVEELETENAELKKGALKAK